MKIPSHAGALLPSAADAGLIGFLQRWALQRFGPPWQPRRDWPGATGCDRCDGLLRDPWSVYHYRVRGRTAAEVFRAEYGALLQPVTREWLRAQSDAWISTWYVEAVGPGATVELCDVLTGTRCAVADTWWSSHALPDSVLLARVVRPEGAAVLGGAHPCVATAEAAVGALADVYLEFFDDAAAIEPGAALAQLQAPGAPERLVRCWEQALLHGGGGTAAWRPVDGAA